MTNVSHEEDTKVCLIFFNTATWYLFPI